MSPRDPGALQTLQRAVTPAAQALHTAWAADRQRRAMALVLLGLPRLAWWVALLVVVAGLVVAVPLWLPVGLWLLLGALWWLALWQQLPGGRSDVLAAAHAVDRAHGNADRLGAAVEFAAQPAPDTPATGLGEALVRAAIADGLDSLPRLDPRRAELPPQVTLPSLRGAALALVALLVLPWLLPRALADRGSAAANTASNAPLAGAAVADAPPRAAPPEAARPVPPPAPRASEPAPERAPSPVPQQAPPPPPKPAAPTPAMPAASGRGQTGSDAAGDSAASGAPKAAPVGNPGSGQSGGGQGASAGGAPEPVPTPPQTKTPSKPKPPPVRAPQPQPDGKPGESAGAPSGPSRGSGRMSAVANKRSDLNRGQEREDDPEIEDEPLADENDEQEQRGGVMPMRRGDQRPPARELSISGDGPPDQGRGGPTPPKKARGTASLILGLRLPDSVRGQPYPGTAKTTLEQIPPRPSEVAPGLALPPPAGRPATPQSARPTTSLLSLQQRYHALLRAAESSASAKPASPSASPKDPQ
jgi:hypothetical protein